MPDFLRAAVYPVLLVSIVGSLYLMAWNQESLQRQETEAVLPLPLIVNTAANDDTPAPADAPAPATQPVVSTE